MKKHSLFIEICIFCFISLFCIIPPFLTQLSNFQHDFFTQWSFPFSYLPYFALSILLISFYSDKEKNHHFLYEILLPSTIVLSLLFFFSLIFKFLSCFITGDFFVADIKVSLPSNAKEWIFCICQFLFAAFFEEVIYRIYYPEAILNFIPADKQNKIITSLVETGVMFVFAFSHFYLGFFAVLNAAIAHFILRTTFKKTKSVLPGFIAHFIYNMISLILL